MNEGQYEEAIFAFEELADFRDSEEKLSVCIEAVLMEKYNSALQQKEERNYLDAIDCFCELGSYKDSEIQIEDCKYLIALQYLEEGERLDRSC